jgi:hypothetical protein
VERNNAERKIELTLWWKILNLSYLNLNSVEVVQEVWEVILLD